MTREIKFRGKRLDNGEWATGDLRHHNDGSLTIITNLNVWSDNNGNVDAYGEEFEVDPETVGQYTGLKDTSGKEIFEGDIFEVKTYGWRAEVEWDKANARFLGRFPNGNICYVGREPSVKIIGNIHDNPSLLERGKK